MSDAFWIALFAMIPPTVAAVASLVVSIRNGKKVEEVRKNTNGLVEDKVRAAREEGRNSAFAELNQGRRKGEVDV